MSHCNTFALFQLSRYNHSFFAVVTLVEAKAMPRRYEELSNDVLIVMAVLGDQEAREERLIRDIMAVRFEFFHK